MKTSNSIKAGVWINVVSVLCNSIAPILNKFAMVSLSPMEAAFWGTLITSLLTILYWIVKPFEISWRLAWQLAPIALCNALGILFLYLSLAHLSPVTFGFMGRLYIVFTTVLSVLILKERACWKEWSFIALAVAGAVLVGLKEPASGESMRGIAYAILYTFMFAVSNLLVKRSLTKTDPMAILLVNNIGGLVVVSTLLLVTASPLHQMTFEAAMYIGGSAIFTFVALATLFVGFRHLSFRLSNLIRATGPLVVAAISWPFFPVTLGLANLSGGALLLFSIFGLCLIERGKRL